MKNIIVNFLTSGGWVFLVILAVWLIQFIVSRTKTQVDDTILNTYVKQGVEFALSVIPAGSTLNWVKFAGNVLGKVNEVFVKNQGTLPNATTAEQIRRLVELITASEEFKNFTKQS
jgi:hypothetical protein